MRYVEAPDSDLVASGPSVFLAGGITGCPDWQQEMVGLLTAADLTLYNPRRAAFPIHDPAAAEAQIRWEHSMLRAATAVSFWFPCETLCPIVLYELGAWSMTGKPLFVGVHPAYTRAGDVYWQTKLARPDVRIVDSLAALAQQVAAWADSRAQYWVPLFGLRPQEVARLKADEAAARTEATRRNRGEG